MRASLAFFAAVTTVLAAIAAPAAAQQSSGLRGLDSRNRNAGPCPNAFALYDAIRVVDFTGNDETYDSIGFTAEIQQVRSLCQYRGDDPIKADLEIDMGFGRGPAAEGRKHTYRYWVAVTRTDQAVIEKLTFPIEVEFDRDEERVFRRERIEEITIPRANDSVSGSNFEIIVGFEVTPEQLNFNRQGKRFTIDAGTR